MLKHKINFRTIFKTSSSAEIHTGRKDGDQQEKNLVYYERQRQIKGTVTNGLHQNKEVHQKTNKYNALHTFGIIKIREYCHNSS